MTSRFDPFEIKLSGTQLIEASAGTGKTYSITSLYLRLILERKLLPEQILVVTFTEAATAELHERVRSRLRKAEKAFLEGGCEDDEFLARLIAASRDQQADRLLLQRALSIIDQAAISTIHGFCYRVLQHDAFESGLPFDLELTAQPDLVLRDIVADFLSRVSCDHDPRLLAFMFENFTEKDFQAIANEAVRHRHYPLQPASQPGAVEELARLAEGFFLEARDIWRAEGENVRQAIAGAAGLTRPFQRILAAGLFSRLDAYLSAPAVSSFRLPADTEKLTSGCMVDPAAGVFTKTAIGKGQVPVHAFFDAWSALAEAIARLAGECQAYFLGAFIDSVRAEFPRRLLADRQMSFDDLLYLLESVLLADAAGSLALAIRGRFPVALIDEFQDTDPVQYRIFWKIYGSSPDASLFLIGDPKQAIYSFRGADINAYLEAAQHPATVKHTMATNWRADRDMVRGVNTLFSPVPAPFFTERITFPEVEPASATNAFQGGEACAPLEFLTIPVDLVPCRKERLVKGALEKIIPELVANDLAQLLNSTASIAGRKIRAGDVAVLVRTNEQAASLQQALRKLRINAVLQSKQSVLQSREAEHLLRLLRGIAEPAEERAVFSALATDFLGYTAADLAELLDNEQRRQQELEQFSRWHALWLQKGVLHLLNTVQEERQIAGRLLGREDGLRKFTNFRHLAELLLRAEVNGLRHTAVVQWLALQGRQSQAADDYELRLESDDDAVQLVTVHRSKGLEYPVVYCPYLWVGSGAVARKNFFSLHDPDDGWQGKFVLFPDARQVEAKGGEEFAENLRLLYVAVTRAKHCCRILWAPASGYDSSALAYLVHGAGFQPGAAGSVREWQSFMASFDFEALHDDLRQRAAGAEGWLVRPAVRDGGRSILQTGIPRILECRTLPGPIAQAWRMSSFSQLTAQTFMPGSPVEDRDHDEAVPTSLPGEAEDDRLPLADFPRGAGAGNFFHEIFETVRFGTAAGREEALRQTIAALLPRYGFSLRDWQKKLPAVFADILAAPFEESGFCLQDIDEARKLPEMEFFFPLAMADAAPGFNAGNLAAVFRKYPAATAGSYVMALEGLHFSALKGFMKGFIDLVYEHGGRWYLIDYKSNFLGECPADYGPEGLARSMAEHHYYLQYHIYTVALDRYLRCRLPDYSYESHFGGVWYLFIRGMRADARPGQAIFFDRPPAARIRLLSKLFEGQEPEE